MSKSNIVLCNYNDYFSRKINDKLTFDGYCSLDGAIYDDKEYNFIPGNGVNTEFVYNYNLNEIDDDILPNYFVEKHLTSTYEEIITRWFIVDSTRTRNGQYRLILKRDVITDFYSTFSKDKFFIQRATVPTNNPLIFNQENIRVNEILTSRTELPDASGVSWIVGFVAPHEDGQTWDSSNITGTIKHNESAQSYTNVDALKNALFGSKKVITKLTVQFSIYRPDVDVNVQYQCFQFVVNWKTKTVAAHSDNNKNYFIMPFEEYTAMCLQEDNILNAAMKQIGTDSYMMYEDFEKLTDQYNNKMVSIDGTKYKPTYKVSDDTNYTYVNVSMNDTLYLTMKELLNMDVKGDGNKIVSFFYTYRDIEIELGSSVGASNNPYIESIVSRPHLNDAPYDMFCIPYKDQYGIGICYTFEHNGSYITKIQSPAVSMSIANAISRIGQSAVYDVQIVPYCPILDDASMSDPTTINTTLLSNYNYIKQENMTIPIGVVIWCTSSSFKTVINKSISWEDTKLATITDKYRICSNNYNGAYEFNPMQNGSIGINKFYVNGTYLPYQSWIRIRPEFAYLNGLEATENDSRGLILQGNLSITRVGDSWQQYQLNNINYEAIFNRGIKNAKINQKWNQIQNGISAIGAGVGAGVASGVALANPIAGAALGVTSAIAGIGDMAINQKLFNESISYQKDMYEMNIGNIQAQPDTLSKVTAINIDTRPFPFIEYYTCTDEEKEYVKNKLEIEGMSVGITDYLYNWITIDTSFVKAVMITSSDTTTSTQIKVAFSEEFSKGVYMKELK